MKKNRVQNGRWPLFIISKCCFLHLLVSKYIDVSTKDHTMTDLYWSHEQHNSVSGYLPIPQMSPHNGGSTAVFHPENSAWGPKWPLKPIFGGQIFQERANVPVSLQYGGHLSIFCGIHAMSHSGWNTATVQLMSVVGITDLRDRLLQWNLY